jgi:UDP-N-acetylmuramate dehydrogenase
MIDIKDYSLLGHNTFSIDAKCHRFVEFNSVSELCDIVLNLRESDQPLLLLGGGSNLLFTGDYSGTVLHSAIKGIEVVNVDTQHGEVFIRCGSGEVFDNVVEYAVNEGYYGLENLSFIPGEVGASAVQNIGAYGAEAKDFIQMIEAVEVTTGKKVTLSNADCCYSYRQSRFKQDWKNHYIITYVTYRLSLFFHPNIEYGNIREKLGEHPEKVSSQQLRKTIIEIRQAKLPDPKVQGNAGSFFMNPIIDENQFNGLLRQFPDLHYYKVETRQGKDGYKISAGWMIDQCGWKGKHLGKAGVHDRQALVLVNLGGATGEDIIRLCNAVRKDVKDKFGLDIRPEVNII